MILTTSRLTLRPPQPGDEVRLFPITSDPEVCRYLKRPGHRDVLETTAYLLDAVKLVSSGRGYCWIIEDQSHEVVGSMSAAYEQGPHWVVFGGYLGRKSWRRGYGLEAGQAVLSWLQDKPHIYRVSAQTDCQNEPINCLVQKLGLKCEGKLRRCWPPLGGGEPRDVYSFAWTR
jgi:ribosomal-protein-alanine N-acetyltransferase